MRLRYVTHHCNYEPTLYGWLVISVLTFTLLGILVLIRYNNTSEPPRPHVEHGIYIGGNWYPTRESGSN